MNKIIFILLIAWASVVSADNGAYSVSSDNTAYQQAMDQWQGASAESLFQVWGDPDGKMKLSSGKGKKATKRIVYSYNRCHSSDTSSGFSSNSLFGNQNQPSTVCCNTKFSVKDDKIVDVQFHGDCVADKSNQWQADE